jgi:hypothetical protein
MALAMASIELVGSTTFEAWMSPQRTILDIIAS